MLFSKDLVFIHVPKTGGTAVRSLLFQVLQKPIYYTYPEPIPAIKDPDIHWIFGTQHEMLHKAREVMAGCGMDILASPLILAIIRNPYAREVSSYAFYSQWARKNPLHQWALEEDFESFVRKWWENQGNRYEEFYKLDGVIPPNLRIVRQENLADDVEQALRDAGIECNTTLRRENISSHADYEMYYTAASEEVVYQKYKWMFDAGYYPRLKPGNTDRITVMRQELQDMKQSTRDRQAENRQLLASVQQAMRGLEQMEQALNDKERWAREADHWAHELEGVVRQQQATIEAYERAFRPFRPFYSLAHGLKKRLVPGS